MSSVSLSLAICQYDHVGDILNGTVRVEGIDLNIQHFPIQDIFYRFTRFREWDVSEMSLGMYVSLLSQGDRSLVAIPVFTSRLFRQSAFFVHRDGPIKTASDLVGRRVGFPDWSHTAGIYARAFLAHDCGVALDSITWVQAGVNGPGRPSDLAIRYPVSVSVELERDLNAMLLDGTLDAIVSSHKPHGAEGVDAPLVRLFDGGMADERVYAKTSGLFPIMHVIALRRDVDERWPWAAANLARAFQEAKQRSVARLRDTTISRFPFPWIAEMADKAADTFGADIWPYGVEANRPTLEAFLRFAEEQGVAHRKVDLAELFTPASLSVLP